MVRINGSFSYKGGIMLPRISKEEMERLEKKGDYRAKLEAFMEGLECQEVEDSLDNWDVDMFRLFGQAMALETKRIALKIKMYEG